jgi:hypothetical protein
VVPISESAQTRMKIRIHPRSQKFFFRGTLSFEIASVNGILLNIEEGVR